MIEADTYRFFHQNGGFPGSAFGYRTKEEEQHWRGRDPLDQTAAHLVRRGILPQSAIDESLLRAKEVMMATGDQLLEPMPGGKPGSRRIRPAEWPDPAFADVGVRGDLSEFAGTDTVDRDTYAGQLAEMKFIDAVSGVMDRRLATDSRIVVMGEDVHRLKGGTNGATRGLKEAYPDRVLGTPISENAFAGLGGGIAIDGRYRPVVEFMYADFMWVAADQLFNQIGKARHMFGGTGAVPLVLRSKVAMGTGYGSQHSMDPAGIFATAPGWRIVAPTTPFDYVGLMNAALRCQDPVVVLEHVDLYAAVGEGPVNDFDYLLPVGKAAVRREGKDVTVLSYLAMVQYVLDGVAEIGNIDAEVIDLRWLDRASIDWDTIEASVQKTGVVVIAEQGPVGTSYGGWLADEIQRRFFDWLDQPVERVTGGGSVAQHQQGARAGGHSAGRRGRQPSRRDHELLTWRGCCGCPRSPLAGKEQYSSAGWWSSRSRSLHRMQSPRSRPTKRSSTYLRTRPGLFSRPWSRLEPPWLLVTRSPFSGNQGSPTRISQSCWPDCGLRRSFLIDRLLTQKSSRHRHRPRPMECGQPNRSDAFLAVRSLGGWRKRQTLTSPISQRPVRAAGWSAATFWAR